MKKNSEGYGEAGSGVGDSSAVSVCSVSFSSKTMNDVTKSRSTTMWKFKLCHI
ncbi:hypothetical protein RP20_CCG016244 [Aedes albopictus]|nr:hypothetical protein RP20_CCG016244 [Aedes albopictus]